MIKVYDQQMQLVAFLENAFTVGYEMPFNALWTAAFSLPANDEKNAECIAFRYVELYDDIEYIGLFRILPSSTKRLNDGATITYSCEHVLATLLDDPLFQFHTVGNAGYPTGNVIKYVLSKQSTLRWRLGVCEFDYQFEYNWENNNLLAALFSVPKPFIDEYMWTWDTTSYPWILNLVRPSEGVEANIRYGINLKGIERIDDPTDLCTRLYCLGYGEGVNQLTISEANNGLPYLNSDTQGQYGIICKTWVDRSIESAEMLKARGQALLEQLKMPRLTYIVDAAELYAITQDPIDKFKVGAQVRVIDEELNIDFVSRVVKYTKGDVWGNPGAVNLEIANKTQDIASAMADLDQRQKINETHSQGATNLNTYNLAENCDPSHPAIFKIWIPDEAVRINKVLLTYENEPFRADSRTIEAAPAITSGPSSTETTAQTTLENSTAIGSTIFSTNYTQPAMSSAGSHNHGIPDGTELLTSTGSVTFSGGGSHNHLLGYHHHNFSSDPHTHNMEHTHEIPSHTHEIDYGIYEGPTASAVGLIVDGMVVPGSSASGTNVDLVNYLKVDEEGKIKRGQFHEIEIIPNNLSRIVANVIIQFFVQSRGGGNY